MADLLAAGVPWQAVMDLTAAEGRVLADALTAARARDAVGGG